MNSTNQIAIIGGRNRISLHLTDLFWEHELYSQSFSRSSANLRCRLDLLQSYTYKDYDDILGKPRCVVVTAAVTPFSCLSSNDDYALGNIDGVMNLAKWAHRSDCHFVYVSGAIVYRNPHDRFINESSPIGEPAIGGSYGKSKFRIDKALQDESKSGLRLSMIRPSSIYGHSLHKSSTIGRWLQKLASGEGLKIERPETTLLNFVYYTDVAKLLFAIVQTEMLGIFNCGGQSAQVIDIAATCARLLGHNKVTMVGKSSSKLPQSLFDLDSTKAFTELNWKARVPIEEGVRLLIQVSDLNQKSSQHP